ncbi:ubiquitin fusion degradation protein 1 homolog isoform X2 [Mangifera indica]|uniref:ubiquitin fusion degradation protein 1 homolog isoform X2 n=1 Tax=Mangifera indica TaxID=29780 RepID=UPI001CF9D112|nr:ubiquitin fusion degradation protein 1 homolog isoform X2 [Mangifera indica]
MAQENNQISTFERHYRCYPVSFIDKPQLEKGDKIVMPASALDRLASLHIEYPMLFELSNTSAGRVTHCGVLEFIADEGLIYLPYWMMENLLLQEGDIVKVRNTSLAKGSYVRLQPHTKDFLDISNPKAILETSLRSYSCLTTGDTIMVPYNNKKYYIDIVETKPSSAVSIIETDCEVDFAPPLDYKEPEKPTSSSLSNRTRPEDDHNHNLSAEEEPAKKMAKFSPFTGSGKRLDGKSSTQPAAHASSSLHKPQQPKADSETNGSKSSASSRQHSGKLVFGSNANHTSNETSKVASKSESQEPPKKMEKPKFQAFTGKKYSLKG